MTALFRHLLVLGRPACGKSEFIDFLKHAPADMRRRRLHIGRFEEVDDFPWLWEKFQDDAHLGEGRLRARSTPRSTCPATRAWPRRARSSSTGACTSSTRSSARSTWPADDFYRDPTLLIEFSRGGANGFRRALGMLDPGILAPAAIFYIHVSREESWRRNVARYQEKLKHSILAHMVPRETYDYFYDINDWEELTGGQPSGWLDVNGVQVPFVTMNNEPESTDPAVLEERYAAALGTLWALRSSR